MTRLVSFSDGTTVPALGQGTWEIGDHPARRDAEQQALARGIDLGLTLIDTAELYGDGRSERLVGEVIAGRRDEVFLVSKCYPQNASRKRQSEACARSLKRLRRVISMASCAASTSKSSTSPEAITKKSASHLPCGVSKAAQIA
jgi:aryl-alcohol dehydrogenase-like predicted oxidoreductase